MTEFNYKENLKEFNKIFVLVSGGIDSTFLYEKIKKEMRKIQDKQYKILFNPLKLPKNLLYKNKVYPVNCFNPYEQNKTLTEISKDPNFIQIKPESKYNYKEILKESFLKLPEAFALKKQKKYHKKIFGCCYHIKHKSFMKNSLFKEENSVVISGIKRGDGTQRRIWLTQMSKGNNPRNQSNGNPTFFHRHLSGQLYCYPLRDYTKRELPKNILDKLLIKYPYLKHTGCFLCPVLVLFNLKNEGKRYTASIKYAKKLGVYPF